MRQPTSKASPTNALSDAVLDALMHPLRYRMQVIFDRQESSPMELAEILDVSFRKICYHVEKLKDAGCIELVGTDNRHGGTQHFYRAIIRPVLDTIDAEKVPRLLREDMSASVIAMVLEDLKRSIDAGIFDSHPARSLLHMRIDVDEEGMQETARASMAYLDELMKIEARSAGRLGERREEGFRLSTATLVYPDG